MYRLVCTESNSNFITIKIGAITWINFFFVYLRQQRYNTKTKRFINRSGRKHYGMDQRDFRVVDIESGFSCIGDV